MGEVWYIRNKKKIDILYPKHQPFGLNYVTQCRTASLSLGIFFEFLILLLITLFSVLFDNYFLWYGFVVQFILHMLTLHLIVLIKFKSYVPGILTFPLVLIPFMWLLLKAQSILQYSIGMILLSTVLSFLILGPIVFLLLHKKMTSWSEWLYKYAQEQN